MCEFDFAGASVHKKGGQELMEQLKDAALLIEATNARQKATVSYTVKMVSDSVGSAQQEQRSAAPSPAPGAQQTEPPQPAIAEALPRQPQAAPQPSAAAPVCGSFCLIYWRTDMITTVNMAQRTFFFHG
jgi:hypothetical protein